MSTERLLQATFACVARYGIAKTTVEDVARESGISRATVYRQFPGGKDQLISETIRWETARFFAELATAIEHAPDFESTLEETMLFARAALGQHAVFQKVLETEPDLLLPRMSVDDSLVRDARGHVPQDPPRARSGAAGGRADRECGRRPRLAPAAVVPERRRQLGSLGPRTGKSPGQDAITWPGVFNETTETPLTVRQIRRYRLNRWLLSIYAVTKTA